MATIEEKEQKIQQLTQFSLEEIKKMSDKDFWTNITYLLAKGVITKEQHEWLDKERCKGWHNDPMSLNALDIFGGKMLE